MVDSRGRNLIGKTVVSEETGRRFGIVGDVNFVPESGELLSVVITNATKYSDELNLEKDENGKQLVPFSSVKSVGDFVIVSEKEVM